MVTTMAKLFIEHDFLTSFISGHYHTKFQVFILKYYLRGY